MYSYSVRVISKSLVLWWILCDTVFRVSLGYMIRLRLCVHVFRLCVHVLPRPFCHALVRFYTFFVRFRPFIAVFIYFWCFPPFSYGFVYFTHYSTFSYDSYIFLLSHTFYSRLVRFLTLTSVCICLYLGGVR